MLFDNTSMPIHSYHSHGLNMPKEADVAVVAAGHYRTEIPGVLNVMNIVAEEFGIECAFRELPTGL